MYLHGVALLCPVDALLRDMLAEQDNLADTAVSYSDCLWAKELTAPQYCNTKHFFKLIARIYRLDTVIRVG